MDDDQCKKQIDAALEGLVEHLILKLHPTSLSTEITRTIYMQTMQTAFAMGASYGSNKGYTNGRDQALALIRDTLLDYTKKTPGG